MARAASRPPAAPPARAERAANRRPGERRERVARRAGISPASVVPGLVNMYWEGTCVGTRDPGGHNCPLDDNGSNCPTNSDPTKQGTVRSKVINVGGTTNQPYTINIEVIGVIGTRCYSGGTRQSTASIMTDGYNNSWYIGGSPSNATDWWNSYEIHVAPSTGAVRGRLLPQRLRQFRRELLRRRGDVPGAVPGQLQGARRRNHHVEAPRLQLPGAAKLRLEHGQHLDLHASNGRLPNLRQDHP